MGINEFIKVGDKIKHFRKNLKLTQEEMANKLSIPRSTYANYESNKREPNSEIIFKICDIFNISPYELLSNRSSENDFIGSTLHFHRKICSLTLKQVEELTGIKEAILQKYENNELVPDTKTLNKLESVYGLSKNTLVLLDEHVSIKLIYVLLESNLINNELIANNHTISPLEIISQHSGIDKTMLYECIRKNKPLPYEDQIRLLKYFANNSKEEFNQFYRENMYNFELESPEIINNISFVSENESGVSSMDDANISYFIFEELIKLSGFKCADLQENENIYLLLSKEDTSGNINKLKLSRVEIDYLLNETLGYIEDLIVKFNGIPNNSFYKKK